MLVIMEKGVEKSAIALVVAKLTSKGITIHRSDGVDRTILGCVGDVSVVNKAQIMMMPGVREIVRVSEPYKLVSRAFHPVNTIVQAENVKIGNKELVIMAGPCAVESEKQIHDIAAHVSSAGAKILRGGAFKPRTSPYSFQGLGEQGLVFLSEAAKKNGLLSVSEVMDIKKLDVVCKYCDIVQVGARNMQNFALLREVGQIDKPVLLKRGLSATYEEFLMAAEYILNEGNSQVILCERGIRTFEPMTRNTLDIGAIPILKKISHLPVITDPSHGIGRRDEIIPMARASIAAGADGLIIEVHTNPDEALSDGAQSLYTDQFVTLMSELSIISRVLGREVADAH